MDAELNELFRQVQADVDGIDLFAPHQPNEDCPICMLPLPLKESDSVFMSCCGKVLCQGCMYKHLTLLRNENEKKKMMNLPTKKDTCAFCREDYESRDRIDLLKKRMRENNPEAFMNMGKEYANGNIVPKDDMKAFEMFAQAALLGSAEGLRAIAMICSKGRFDRSDVTARAILEIGVKKNSVSCRQDLAKMEERDGNMDMAIKHWKVAARAGSQESLDELMKAFRANNLAKDELNEILRAFQASNDEVKSKDRDDNARAMAVARKQARKQAP